MAFENLYVHLPFCRSKCGYCGFFSLPGNEEVIDAYLTRLEAVIKENCPPEAATVYVGGGTPTLLSERQLAKLAEMLPEAGERSIEANPETLTPEKVALLAQTFDRISLGVQSFHAPKRARLGRDCSDFAIRNALALISDAPFRHRNIDLIYAVTGDTPGRWRQDLETALSYPVDHLSCYALTLEENARLAPETAADRFGELEAELSAITLETLSGRLARYEISNYAAFGGECRHNLNVWSGKSYFGAGAGAHGFDGKVHFAYPEDVPAFIAGNPPENEDGDLSPEELELEIFAFNLRTVGGWSRAGWEARGGSWNFAQRVARRAAAFHPEFWRLGDDFLRLTELGLDFWNTVAEEVMFSF